MPSLKHQKPPNQSARQILQKIESRAISRIPVGKILGEGSFSTAYKGILENGIGVTTSLSNPHKSEFDVVKIVAKETVKGNKKDSEDRQQTLVRQAQAKALLIKKEVRSPFLSGNLFEGKDGKIAVEGRDLDAYLYRYHFHQSLPPSEAWRIIAQLTLGSVDI